MPTRYAPIRGASQYQATSDGTIQVRVGLGLARWWRDVNVSPPSGNYKYYRLSIRYDGHRRSTQERLHTLVATAFHGDRPSSKHLVRHLDEDKSNNCPENLKWGTNKENSQDMVRNGTASGKLTGDAHPRRREVPLALVKEWVKRRKTGESFANIARGSGYHYLTVRSKIRNRIEEQQKNPGQWWL